MIFTLRLIHLQAFKCIKLNFVFLVSSSIIDMDIWWRFISHKIEYAIYFKIHINNWIFDCCVYIGHMYWHTSTLNFWVTYSVFRWILRIIYICTLGDRFWWTYSYKWCTSNFQIRGKGRERWIVWSHNMCFLHPKIYYWGIDPKLHVDYYITEIFVAPYNAILPEAYKLISRIFFRLL